MRSQEQRPYKAFGDQLKSFRQIAHQTPAEVSGAVEIDESTLVDIEAGKKLPDEDILILLMNHFGIKDDTALKLWELAGYAKEDNKTMNEEQLLKQIMMVVPMENKVAYSDNAHISANKNGVTIDFKLSAGNSQPQVVSRVGMSLEQAEALATGLLRNITLAKKPLVQKALPASNAIQVQKNLDSKK